MKKKLACLMTEEKQKKILAVLMTVVFVIILIPLFRIAHYNFMCVDDYEYGLQPGRIWKETGSVLRVLAAQVVYTWEYYFRWQGTFFSEWLSTSLIGIFAEDAYYIGTYISLGGFVLAEGWMLMVAFRYILKADKYLSWVVTLACMMVQILTVVSPSEAFFWFCSAILYTGCLAIAFCLVALWILVYYGEDRTKWKSCLLSIDTALVTVAVGGGNYIVGLVVLVLYLGCVGWFLYKKHHRRRFMSAMGLLYLAAFLLNVLAPGNSNRQDALGQDSLSAIGSIMLSLKEALFCVIDNIALLSVVLAVLFVPIFVKMVQNSDFKWRFPLLVTLISFGVYAAQFTPTIFSMGNIGPGRAQNLYGMTFWLWLYGNELYWTGWIVRWLQGRKNVKSAPQKSYLLGIWMAGAVLLVIGLLAWDGTISSNSAFQSLRSGEAQAYYQEHQQRLEILENPDVKIAYLKPFSARPYVLYFRDLSYDFHDWANKTVATYYEKELVGYAE